MKDATLTDDVSLSAKELEAEIDRLRSDLQHEREMRQEQIESLRREITDSQEKLELRLRLELSEKLRQLPRGE